MSVASENFQICFPQNFSDASEFFQLFSSIWFWSVRNKIKKLSVATDKFNCVDFAYPLWDTKCARTREWDIVNLWKIQVALKSRLFWKCVRTVFFLIKVDFKLTWNQGKIHELPWNQSCFQNAPELFFEIKVKIHLDFRGEIHVLPWNQGCFQNVREPAFHNHYNSNKWSGREMMGNWS